MIIVYRACQNALKFRGEAKLDVLINTTSLDTTVRSSMKSDVNTITFLAGFTIFSIYYSINFDFFFL